MRSHKMPSQQKKHSRFSERWQIRQEYFRQKRLIVHALSELLTVQKISHDSRKNQRHSASNFLLDDNERSHDQIE